MVFGDFRKFVCEGSKLGKRPGRRGGLNRREKRLHDRGERRLGGDGRLQRLAKGIRVAFIRDLSERREWGAYQRVDRGTEVFSNNF
mgnify:CR=1 FL=1